MIHLFESREPQQEPLSSRIQRRLAEWWSNATSRRGAYRTFDMATAAELDDWEPAQDAHFTADQRDQLSQAQAILDDVLSECAPGSVEYAAVIDLHATLEMIISPMDDEARVWPK